MQFVGPVYRLVMSQDGEYVGACSNDCFFEIYNAKQNKIYRPRPSHDSSCLHVGFNSTVQYVASTGCEGVLNIYSIAKMIDNPLTCLIKSQKISKETKLDNLQILRFDW